MMKKYKVNIDGMMCGHCVSHVTDALKAIGGVNINVSLSDGTAEFSADCNEDKIKSAIEDEGYSVTSIADNITSM